MGTTQKQTRLRGGQAGNAKGDVLLKSRSEGMTTDAAKRPIIGNEPQEKKEDPEQIRLQIAFFTHTLKCATLRKARYEDLMQRRGSRKWDAAKKAQMVRRLTTANQEMEQSEHAVDQLTNHLAQIVTSPKRVNDVAPFVPAPATSM